VTTDGERREAAREILSSALEDIRGLHVALEEWDRAGQPADRAPFWIGHLYGTGGRWRAKVLKFREEHFGDD
jgi:hypothetical protein